MQLENMFKFGILQFDCISNVTPQWKLLFIYIHIKCTVDAATAAAAAIDLDAAFYHFPEEE